MVIALNGGAILVHKMVRPHALHRPEVRRRCDDGDVLVEDVGQAVIHRPDDILVAPAVTEDVILSAQHLLGLSDRDADGDPVSGMRTLGRSGVEIVSLESKLYKVY